MTSALDDGRGVIEGLLRSVVLCARAAPFELWPTLVILSGIAIFNRQFAHLGFQRLYVTEVLLFATLLVALVSVAFSFRHRAILREVCGPDFRLFHLLLVYAIARLVLGQEYGLLAVRHSMMVFFIAFVPLFMLAFSSPGSLVGTLRYLLVLTSVFNAAKIFRNWAIGSRMEAEPLRVAHNEVDVICASLSLIGLWLLSRRAGWKHWLWLAPLTACNLLILLLTVKRTAAVGLLVVLALGVVLTGGGRGVRAFARIGVVAAACAVLLCGVVAILTPESVAPIAAFLAEKLRFSTEANAVWRLTAWGIAWQRFQDAPLFGIGYGLPILQSALRTTRTDDPHNSLLAFLVRHGLVGGALFLGLLGQVCLRYLRRMSSSSGQGGRRLTAFFFLAFIYMVVFASFNVVLENQYEGMFFWLAVSGAFIGHTTNAPAAALSTEATGGQRPVAAGWQLFFGSPLAWVRGIAIAGAGAYLLLIVSPWNYLPRIDIYTPARQAQLPLAETDGGATVRLASTSGGLQVAVEQRWPTWSAIKWALPEKLTDDFRLEIRPREERDAWSAVKWMLPEDFTRTVCRGIDYAIVLELGSRDQARKPYAFYLEDVSGRRYRATGRAVGNARVVSLSEFEEEGPVRWKDVRHLLLRFPPLRRTSSLQVRSLSVARQVEAPGSLDAGVDAPIRDCATKRVATQCTLTGFETYGGPRLVNRIELGGGPDRGMPRGSLWTRDDGTGAPVFEIAGGARGTKNAIRASNPRASAWGTALGLSLACLDASAFDGIEFWVRGTAPSGEGCVAVEMRDTRPPGARAPDEGTCVGADPHDDCYAPRACFAITDGWKKTRLPWFAFQPGFNGSTRATPDGDDIIGLSFAVALKRNTESGQAQSAAVELAVDEIGFF